MPIHFACVRVRGLNKTESSFSTHIDSGVVKLNSEFESGLKLIISSLYALLFDYWKW